MVLPLFLLLVFIPPPSESAMKLSPERLPVGCRAAATEILVVLRIIILLCVAAAEERSAALAQPSRDCFLFHTFPLAPPEIYAKFLACCVGVMWPPILLSTRSKQ